MHDMASNIRTAQRALLSTFPAAAFQSRTFHAAPLPRALFACLAPSCRRHLLRLIEGWSFLAVWLLSESYSGCSEAASPSIFVISTVLVTPNSCLPLFSTRVFLIASPSYPPSSGRSVSRVISVVYITDKPPARKRCPGSRDFHLEIVSEHPPLSLSPLVLVG